MGLGSTGVRLPDGRLLDLAELGISSEQWGRLPGTLRDEVVQAAEEKAPAEYRDLIKRYFKQISQQASRQGEGGLLDALRGKKDEDKQK